MLGVQHGAEHKQVWSECTSALSIQLPGLMNMSGASSSGASIKGTIMHIKQFMIMM